MLAPRKKSYDKPRQHIKKKKRHFFANKVPYSQDYGFSSSHVWMWGLDHKESWVLKNWCFWTVVLEKTLESPLDCKEIQPVNPKRNQSWIFTGKTDAETEAPILWPPDAKIWLIRKDPNDGKEWRQEEKGITEDEMVGWHHQLDGHEFEQASRVGEGQGSLSCCSPWGCKDLDMTERLNWIELNHTIPGEFHHHLLQLQPSSLWMWLPHMFIPTEAWIETFILVHPSWISPYICYTGIGKPISP